MKKIYFNGLMAIILAITFTDLVAQPNSVTLIPPTGPAVNYPSITAAYNSIPPPLTGNYLIEIQAPYTGTDASEVYPITLGDKALLPGGFTITIRPAAGNNGEIIQRVTNANNAVIAINGGDNIIIDGRPGGVTSVASNYLTINDPVVGSSTNRNIELFNSANNNTIQYVNCTAAEATAGALGSRVILIGATTTVGNRNNTIQNCVVTGGLRGIQDFGQSDALPNVGTVIQNNTVRNFGAIGIFAGTANQNITIQGNTIESIGFNALPAGQLTGIQQQSLVEGTSLIANNRITLNITSTSITAVTGIIEVASGTDNISGNTITNLTAPAATSVVGISLNPGASTININSNAINGLAGAVATSVIAINASGTAIVNYTISRNRISGLTSASGGIRGMSIFPFAGSTVNVDNNFVALMDNNGGATAIFGMLYGLTAAGSNYTANINFNSVRIGGVQAGANNAGAYGIYRGDNNATSVYNQKNNICMMERTGGGATAIYIGYNNPSTAGVFSVDYNTYYATDPLVGYAAAYNGTGYKNAGLVEYKTATAPQEQNSNFVQVTFVSATDLHLSGASNTDPNLNGTPVPGIVTDIDGQNRSAATPSRGADEKGTGAVPVTLSSFNAYRSGASNTVSWSTAQEINTRMFVIERSTDGRVFNEIGNVAAAGTSNTTRNYQFVDLSPVRGINYYRLKTRDVDNSGLYSEIRSVKNTGNLNVSIYPNPVISEMSVELYSAKETSAVISIINMNGSEVYNKTANVIAGNNKVAIDLTSISAGSFVIRVIMDDEKEVKKFVKL